MTPRILAALSVGCGLLLAGCLPESKNPLSLPSASLIDTRLEGVYAQRGKDGKESPGYWHFHYRGTRAPTEPLIRQTRWLEILSVESAKDGDLKTHRYEALATPLGGHDYLSFIDPPEPGAKKKTLPYSFARYDVNWRGDLRVWITNNKAFAAAIKAGQLRGKVIPGKFGDSVELTDTTARLAAFVSASDPKTLFDGEPLVLRRIAR
jgi:hypothetical protein